jgi:hypothetical protein
VHSRAGDLLHLVYAPELSHTLDAGDRRREGGGGGAPGGGAETVASGEERESDAATASSSSINRFKYTVLLCDTMKPRERAELFLGEQAVAQLTETPRAQLTETRRAAPLLTVLDRQGGEGKRAQAGGGGERAVSVIILWPCCD